MPGKRELIRKTTSRKGATEAESSERDSSSASKGCNSTGTSRRESAKETGTAKKASSGFKSSAHTRLMDKLKAINAIVPFEQSVVAKPRVWLESEMLNLNWALGHGVPFGCLWELIGAESSSKSTTALSIAASLQRTHNALIIPYDTERLDDSMLLRTGLDLSKAAIPEPEAKDCVANVVNNMMAVLQTIIDANEEGDYDGDGPTPVIMIWDSIAATATQTMKQAMSNTRDGVKVGIIAEQMSATAGQLTTALKTLHPAIVKAGVLAIFVNQMRVTMATPGMSSWGGPQEHSGGGRALKHAANIRGKMKYENIYRNFNGGKKDITKGPQQLGIMCSLDMIKNKLAAPFKKIGFINMFKSGIDITQSNILHALFDLESQGVLPPVVKGRIQWNGRGYYIPDFARVLSEDEIALAELKERILAAQETMNESISAADIARMQRESDMAERDDDDEEVEVETADDTDDASEHNEED